MTRSLLTVEGRVRLYAFAPELLPVASPDPLWLASNARLCSVSNNLIVTSGLQWISRKLGHILGTPPVQVGGQTLSDIDDLKVTKIQLGNSAAPSTPAAGDTALSDVTPLATFTSLTVSYPANGTVRHSATISPDTLNGEPVTEIGLFITVNSTDILVGRALPSPVTVISPSTAYLAAYDIILSAS